MPEFPRQHAVARAMQLAGCMTPPHRIRSLASFAVVLGCSGTFAACSAQTPEATRSEKQPFATALAGEPVHEEITAEALPFLQPAILAAVQEADVSVDVELALVNANHFDDCNFTGGAAVIRGYQSDAIAALDPANASPETDAQAIAAFGRWLHTAQDFYSHSNWVESSGRGIVESSLGAWPSWTPYEILSPSGFVLVQGTPPPRTSVTRRDDEPYPEDAIVRVKSAQSQELGVMTGTVDYEPGDFCPPSIAMTHADLNKDKSDIVGRESEFVTAKSLAVEQTHHEWCRLLAMLQVAYGDAGETRVLAWTSDPSAASCP